MQARKSDAATGTLTTAVSGSWMSWCLCPQTCQSEFYRVLPSPKHWVPLQTGARAPDSRAHILSLGCKGTAGGQFLPISTSRMGDELCLPRQKIPDAGFLAFTFVLLKSAVSNPQKDFISFPQYVKPLKNTLVFICLTSQVSLIIVNNPIKLGLLGEAGYSIQSTFVFHFCFVSKTRKYCLY